MSGKHSTLVHFFYTLDSVTLLSFVFVLQKNNSDKAIRRPRGLLSLLRVDRLTFAGQ